jgi:hypothetical protein
MNTFYFLITVTEMIDLQFDCNVSETKSGRMCQKWTDQFPHEHEFRPEWSEIYNGIGNHNFCRKVNQERAWCYTIAKGLKNCFLEKMITAYHFCGK